MTGAEIAIIVAATAGAGASVQSGRVQAKSAKANAEFNSAVARDEAKQKENAGKLEAERVRRNANRLRGTQEVGFAKAGVTNEGTPIDLMIRSAAEEELNAQNVQQNFDVSASRSRSEAGLSDFRGSQAGSLRTAGNLQGGATLLGGVATAALARQKRKNADK